jgi:predicted amidophosphoribosyltransferase
MRALLDLLYPPRCAGCDLPGTLLCGGCAAEVVHIDPACACPRCGAPRVCGVSAARGGCAECVGRALAFSAARCAALLAPPVSRAVVVLKDGGERRYAEPLAALLAEAATGWLQPGDILVPVPASPAALRRRGFDHADDIARALGKLTGMPVARLLRSNASADQRVLGRAERLANRTGAFSPLASAAAVERVVLIDDVFTTGATLSAAAGVLHERGVGVVRALAVARAIRAGLAPVAAPPV